MWIITEKGDARNLAQAYKIEFGEYRGKVKVTATFPICTGKNSADPAFAETATLKTFDNVDDAKEFIWDLVNVMNCDAENFDWVDATDDGEEEVKGTQGDLEDKPLHKGENLIDGIPL